MLDDEDTGGSGLGGAAWYQMGRWAAETDRERQDLCKVLTGNAPVSRADYNYVVSLNEGLNRKIAWFRSEVQKGNDWLREWKGCWESLKARYDQLKAKADSDAAALAQAKTDVQFLLGEIDKKIDVIEEYEADIADGLLVRITPPDGPEPA